MDESLLRGLCKNLNLMGGSLPVLETPKTFELFEELFNEEEAKIAGKMPPVSASLADLSKTLSVPQGDLFSHLESMADKGIVATRRKDGVVLYKLLPVVPGVFEMQLLRGGSSDRDRKVARLLRACMDAGRAYAKEIAHFPDNVTPFGRVIPVERSIQAGQKVYTFDQLSRYIESTDAISVGHCYCHHEKYLLGEETCDAPEYRCMSFGPGALYTSERGISRLITKEEALEILKNCEEKGLVHMGSNTSRYLEYMCNCCSCHCGVLRELNKFGKPVQCASSGYLARINHELCTACGTCAEMCQMKAISMQDEQQAAMIDQDRCIGCGVCASLCPVEAIFMDPREGLSPPPETPRELRKAIRKDIQRVLTQ